MSNYTPSTDFASKDSLLSGDPAKVVKGTEFSTEFSAIQTAVATKADANSSDAFQAGTTTLGATSVTALTDSGNLNLTGAAARITGDFSNATLASRAMFQTSTVNSATGVRAIPNGTSNSASVGAFNNSDPTNASIVNIGITATEAQLQSATSGTGTYLPLVFNTSATEKLRIAADATGTYTFGGTAPRITGDFSNATVASRVMFQTSTVNGGTSLCAIPNGTNQTSSYNAFNAGDPANASTMTLLCAATEARVQTSITGTGTYLPMTFYTGGSERMRIATDGSSTFNGLTNFVSDINLSTGTDQYVYFDGALHLAKNGTGDRLVIDTSGNVGIGAASSGAPLYVYSTAATAKYIHAQHSGSYNSGLNVQNSVSSWYAYVAATTGNFEFFRGSGTGDVVVISPVGLGYGTGAGGTVTQATSRTTAVTLNKPTGSITMFTAAGSATPAQFSVNNSLVGANDVVVLSYKSSSNVYQFVVSSVSAGVFNITFWAQSGVASDTPVINFAIIKGATA